MHLSLHADYALRTLIYAGSHPDTVVSTAEISRAYGISKHHLVRVVQTLGEHGYLDVIPGRAGGLRLARLPAAIRVGEVVRRTEPHLRLLECFDEATNTCPILGECSLKAVVERGLRAFLAELDTVTLADLLPAGRASKLVRIFDARLAGTSAPSDNDGSASVAAGRASTGGRGAHLPGRRRRGEPAAATRTAS